MQGEKRIIKVGVSCWLGDCNCMVKNGMTIEQAGLPPYHEHCSCMVISVPVGKVDNQEFLSMVNPRIIEACKHNELLHSLLMMFLARRDKTTTAYVNMLELMVLYQYGAINHMMGEGTPGPVDVLHKFIEEIISKQKK